MRAFRLSAAALCLSAAFLSFPSAYAAEPAGQEVISASGSYLQSIQWDAEYDVVIAGYGFAGAAAAIAAADAGANVLMVEKAPYGKEGGNSRYAHQGCLFFDPSAPDDELFAYMKAMQNGADNPSDEVIRTYIKETKHQAEYLRKLGADPKVTPNAAEFPDFKGAKYIQRVFVSLPGADGKLYALMQENVEKRASRIDIWYESPAVKLLQDEKTGIVHGLVVKSEGRDRFIRARRGVVLATGGFENNPRMYEN
ncbi:FAD-dependent oxidoreductase, partial [Sutterella wadsworthensis]|uniref:FAD-dependent oxidoreductase n=1 Tax=Sutterella wadsworthensis TaxID=40545 RepID=UPI00307A61DD